MSSSSLIDPRHLVQILRQRLVADLGAVLGELGGKVQDRLMHLMDERVDSNRLMHERRDAYQAYVRARNEWVSACSKALRQALVPPSEATKEKISAGQFQLIDNEVMENKILSSRLVLTLMETAGVEFADLKRRVQNLEDGRALADHDVLRPEVFCQILVDQWTRCGLTRAAWVSVREALQATLAPALRDAYAKANAWLAHNGVDAVQDLKVKRVGGGQGLGAVAVPSSAPAPLGAPSVSGSATDRPAASQPGLGGGIPLGDSRGWWVWLARWCQKRSRHLTVHGCFSSGRECRGWSGCCWAAAGGRGRRWCSTCCADVCFGTDSPPGFECGVTAQAFAFGSGYRP